MSARLEDAQKLLDQLLSDCSSPDEHSWKTCDRCLAMHGLENRFKLTMRLLRQLRGKVWSQEELQESINVAVDRTLENVRDGRIKP